MSDLLSALVPLQSKILELTNLSYAAEHSSDSHSQSFVYEHSAPSRLFHTSPVYPPFPIYNDPKLPTMGFQIVDIQHRRELVHGSKRGTEGLKLLLGLNWRNGILSPCGSITCSGTFSVPRVRTWAYLEQASIAFANAAVAVDIASSAFLYAFAADINCQSAAVAPTHTIRSGTYLLQT
jgi:hypothetical protein